MHPTWYALAILGTAVQAPVSHSIPQHTGHLGFRDQEEHLPGYQYIT